MAAVVWTELPTAWKTGGSAVLATVLASLPVAAVMMTNPSPAESAVLKVTATVVELVPTHEADDTGRVVFTAGVALVLVCTVKSDPLVSTVEHRTGSLYVAVRIALPALADSEAKAGGVVDDVAGATPPLLFCAACAALPISPLTSTDETA